MAMTPPLEAPTTVIWPGRYPGLQELLYLPGHFFGIGRHLGIRRPDLAANRESPVAESRQYLLVLIISEFFVARPGNPLVFNDLSVQVEQIFFGGRSTSLTGKAAARMNVIGRRTLIKIYVRFMKLFYHEWAIFLLGPQIFCFYFVSGIFFNCCSAWPMP